MFEKFFKKSNRIRFTVIGKPPKKTAPSLWSEKSKQTELVVNLRQKAFEEIQKTGLNEPFHGPVQLTLTVYAPNVLVRKDRNDYLGDIDSLIGGVFEALQPSPPEDNNLKIHSLLKEIKEIRHDVALIIGDDAQITTSVGKKIKRDGEISYTVLIESE